MKLWQTKAGNERMNYICKTPEVHIRTSTKKSIPSKTTDTNVRHTLPVCNAESGKLRARGEYEKRKMQKECEKTNTRSHQ
jgi:hypothetical protein